MTRRFDVLFSFELRNEYVYQRTSEPSSWDSGIFVAANGDSYDMADPAEHRRLAEDGFVYWTNEMWPPSRR